MRTDDTTPCSYKVFLNLIRGWKCFKARAKTSYLFFILTLLSTPLSALAQVITFDDSAADLMVLGNDMYYEVGFSKENGAIVYVTDNVNDAEISSGSEDGALWSAWMLDVGPVPASRYGTSGPYNFSYQWRLDTFADAISYLNKKKIKFPVVTLFQLLTR